MRNSPACCQRRWWWWYHRLDLLRIDGAFVKESMEPADRWSACKVALAALLLLCAVGTGTGSNNVCVSGHAHLCRECLLLHPDCAWCAMKEYPSGNSRCDLLANLVENGCPRESLEKSSSHVRVEQSNPLSDTGSGSAKQITQLTPQKITLTMMTGAPAKFQLKVRQVEDYPVDLYYLMDLSMSMRDDLDTIRNLGTDLSREMAKLTSNFRLGFGSFIDKPVSPFVQMFTDPEYAKNPCQFRTKPPFSCPSTYGYHHVLPLTNEVNKFNEEVQKQEVSPNRDAPEGGMDAILQATVCKEQIGWRREASHLLVFTTDDHSHFALDGRLAGIVQPSDGLCHLDSNNVYVMTDSMDYPSIALVSEKLSENNINLIFAVTKEFKEIYTNYTDLIPGTTVEVLTANSNNIIQLIVSSYKSLRSKVELEVWDQPEELSVSFSAICQDGNPQPGQKKCTDLNVGDTVSFDITVEARGCPSQPVEKTLKIKPVGFKDALEVRVLLSCGCACEKSATSNSTECNEQGKSECGVCLCQEGRLGSTCECSAEGPVDGSSGGSANATRGDSGLLLCGPLLPNQPVCGGRGECVCGVCVCYTSEYGKIYGKQCECDSFSCGRHRDQLCGGHGDCNCGECRCHVDWSGDLCNCTTRMDTCESSDGLLCSGRGDCTCGRCVCTTAGSSGDTCERCLTCTDVCTTRRPCVECKIYKVGKYANETDCFKFCKIPITSVDTLGNDSSAISCSYKDENDCDVQFTYMEDAFGKSSIAVLNHLVCPAGPNMLAVILGVTAGILLIGLAMLLIWKLLISMHDRREFARFEEEKLHARWDSGQNPLYKNTVTTFKNVAYKGTGAE